MLLTAFMGGRLACKTGCNFAPIDINHLTLTGEGLVSLKLYHMRRLLTLGKKFSRVTPEFMADLEDRVKVVSLEPGDLVSERIPVLSWIFVEEGLLAQLGKTSTGSPTCKGFLLEGSAKIFTGRPGGRPSQQECDIKAVERSIVLYLLPEDEHALNILNMGFEFARTYMMVRTEFKLDQRAKVLDIDEGIDRVIFMWQFYPMLLRAPIGDLADWLDLKSEAERAFLENVVLKHSSNKIAVGTKLSDN